jgi:hypothetical protein
MKEAEALDRLTDARAELARYRKICRGLTAGASIGTAAFLSAILSAMLLLPTAFGIGLAGISSIATVVCTIILICQMVTAHSTSTNYSTYQRVSNHPADKVRAAERAYERAVMEAK